MLITDGKGARAGEAILESQVSGRSLETGEDFPQIGGAGGRQGTILY